MTTRRRLAGLLILLVWSGTVHSAQQTPSPASLPAAPKDAVSALSTRSAPLVAIGDAHGNAQGLAFQSALVRDLRFAAVVDDIRVETGNSAYQDVLDRFVRGESVPEDELRRETAQPQVAPWNMPELIAIVRQLNAARPSGRRLRVLLGEPPLDWSTIHTVDDLRRSQSDSAHDRDRFAAALLKREVFDRGPRALALYGAGHFFRKNVSHSLVSVIESEGSVKAFTVWANAVADLTAMQADVASWPVPQLGRGPGHRPRCNAFQAFVPRVDLRPRPPSPGSTSVPDLRPRVDLRPRLGRDWRPMAGARRL